MKQLKLTTFLLFFWLVMLKAHANSDTLLSGFGTIGAAWFSNPHADYFYNQMTTGPGRSQPFDMALDSNLGIQLDHRWNHYLSTGVQLISFHNTDNNFSPEFSLAFLRIHLAENLSLRLGRLQNPAFLYADSRHVNFDQIGVRPAKNVYGLSPLFQIDGAEISYQQLVGKWHTELQLGMGSTDFSLAAGHIKFQNQYIRLVADKFPWTFSSSYSLSNTTLDSLQLSEVLTLLSQLGYAQIAQDLSIDHKDIAFFTLSTRYDNQNWLFLSEYGHQNSHTYLGIQQGAYLTLGKYFGSNLFYASYAKRWNNVLNPQVASAMGNSIISAINFNGKADSEIWTLGLRHELMENMRIKVQADLIQPTPNSLGPYTNMDTTYLANIARPDTDLLISLSLDFIF
jgi:hypothetical protein